MSHRAPRFSSTPMAVSLLLLLLSAPAVRADSLRVGPWTALAPQKDYVVSPPWEPEPDTPFVTIEQMPWQVVYLNFDGETLVLDQQSDSKTNKTTLIVAATLDYPALDWAPYGGKEQGVKAVVDALKLIYLDYAVKLVTERPTEGDYTMAMIGGTGEGVALGSSATLGVAPLDCDNSNKNDICVIFGDKFGGSVEQLAETIAHELGHTFGLEHVSDEEGLMHGSSGSKWVTSPLSEPSSCGRSEQDDDAILKANVGEGKQDTLPPLVWIIRPGEGAILPPDFSFEVTAADDLAVHHVVVFLDGTKVLELSEPPYTLALTELSDGEHVLRAEAHDWVELTAEAEVRVTVDSACPGEGTCTRGIGGPGHTCQGGADCLSGVCALKEGEPGRCVERCDGGAEASICPKDTSCLEEGSEWACLPEAGWSLDLGDDGGGCALASDQRGAPGGLLLLVGLLLLAQSFSSRRSRARRMRPRPSS